MVAIANKDSAIHCPLNDPIPYIYEANPGVAVILLLSHIVTPFSLVIQWAADPSFLRRSVHICPFSRAVRNPFLTVRVAFPNEINVVH